MAMFGRGERSGRRRSADPVGEEAAAAPASETVRVADARARSVRVPRAPGAVVLDGRYEIGRLVGTGGTATVHVARDLLLGREVAIKLFRREGDSAPDLRLQQIEARVVATLSHSSLTTLLDAGAGGIDGGPPQIYLVMEYVRGENLRQRVKRAPLEVSEACWLGFDVAEGLDHMHQAGFLHRDIKPANILISEVRSARPVVAKLTDFGIAAPIGQPDLSEYTIGTAAYLSPEQVEGRDARPESDIYSLGLVLLEAMTGRVAFPGTVEASAFARLSHDPTIPSSIPAPVADLLARMTAREPGRRVPLHQVAVELQQFLVDDLVRRRTAALPAPAPREASGGTAAAPLVIDGAPDPTCDALLRLAARSLGAPKALLAVDDGQRLSLKSQVGWAPQRVPFDPDAARFPPSGTRPWAVGDVHHDRAVAGASLPIADRTIRSAAGAPLVAHDGRRLGTVAVFDDVPRDFGGSDLATLQDVADLLVHEFELRGAARRALLGDR